MLWRRRGLNPGPFRNFAKCKRNALPLRHIPFDVDLPFFTVYVACTANPVSEPLFVFHGLLRRPA